MEANDVPQRCARSEHWFWYIRRFQTHHNGWFWFKIFPKEDALFRVKFSQIWTKFGCRTCCAELQKKGPEMNLWRSHSPGITRLRRFYHHKKIEDTFYKILWDMVAILTQKTCFFHSQFQKNEKSQIVKMSPEIIAWTTVDDSFMVFDHRALEYVTC